MTIEVVYNNGSLDYINMNFCCPTLSWCKAIGLKEDSDSRDRRFYMAIKKSEVVRNIDANHVTMKNESTPINFCPFCGEEIEIVTRGEIKK